jgi:uncharacterized C2H2 Zn-finger protein
MVNYVCSRCSKQFNHKGDYTRHVSRRFPCKKSTITEASDNKHDSDDLDGYSCTSDEYMDDQLSIDTDGDDTSSVDDRSTDSHLSVDSDTLECGYCSKAFSNRSNLKRHLKLYCDGVKTAKIKELAYQKLMEEMNSMRLAMKKQQTEIIKLKKTGSEKPKNSISIGDNSTQNITTTVQNIANDIKIVAFGKEDLYSLLTDEEVKRYLNKGYQSVYELIDYLHFDPNKPEMHNVYISNIKDPYALKFDGERWRTVEKDDVIDQLFDDKACYLNSMFKELRNGLPSKTKIKYSRFMTETEKAIIDGLKRDIKLLLYNKRDIPMRTRNGR